jgi:hypothetical protein
MKRLKEALSMKRLSRTAASVAILSFAGHCRAASPLEINDFADRTPTSYMFFDYGLATYKSKLVDSNDTAGAVTYGFGLNAGENRNFGVEYRVETATVAFETNQSSLTSNWTSTIFKYRLWAFELGPVIGSVKMSSKRENAEIFDIVGGGYGGYFGILMPIGSKNIAYMNAMSVATASPVDTQARTITMGSRMDLELGTKIKVTRKAVDFVVGYRRRTLSITEGGSPFSELQTATFFGFNVGSTF